MKRLLDLMQQTISEDNAYAQRLAQRKNALINKMNNEGRYASLNFTHDEAIEFQSINHSLDSLFYLNAKIRKERRLLQTYSASIHLDHDADLKIDEHINYLKGIREDRIKELSIQFHISTQEIKNKLKTNPQEIYELDDGDNLLEGLDNVIYNLENKAEKPTSAATQDEVVEKTINRLQAWMGEGDKIALTKEQLNKVLAYYVDGYFEEHQSIEIGLDKIFDFVDAIANNDENS